MADSFQEDSFVEDSFSPESSNDAPTFTQGMFKTYKGKPKGLAQTADVATAKVAKFGLDLLNAPFEAAGEAVAAPIEGRYPVRPTVFGGKGAENPFSLVNKLLRASAGAVSGIPGGTPLESARTAYNAPRGGLGVAEDTAMALLLGKVAPEVAAAPMDAAIMGVSKTAKGVANAVSAGGKKALRIALGPTEEAQTALLNRPQDMAKVTNFQGLGDKLADTTSALSKKLSELDDKAWQTLPIDETVPKAKIVSIIENVKKEFIGKGNSKIGEADAKAVKQLDKYIEKIKGVTQEAMPADDGMTVAIKLRGKTYTGKPGEIHADLINRMAKELKEDPDTVIGSVQKIGDMGFSIGKKFLTRSEASEQLGGARPEAASLMGEGLMPKTAAKAVKASQTEISHPQLKDIIQSVEKDARYDLPENDPANLAVQGVRSKIDQYLKSKNKAYGEAMVPVAETTAALKDTVKRFRLERTPEGYVPTKVTVDRLKSLPKDNTPEIKRTIESLKNVTGSDFADEARLTDYKEQFTAGERTRGSARTAAGAGLGMLMEHFVPGPPGIATGTGALMGRSMDYYGGPMAKMLLDVLGKAKSGVGNVLSAVNAKTQGTPYQSVIQNIVQGNPALLPLLKGGR